METRIDMSKVAPEGYKAILGLEKYIASTSLDPIHKELIKIRASQINGCAFCIDMHTKDARKLGLSEQRIYLLNAWRDTNLYSEKEKAILTLTEEVTLISHHVSDATYQNASKVLGEDYLAIVIMMIITINAWNRIAITTGMQPE
ncbi:carboxymuconolactone decarboxylase family protein [Flavobacterium sp.]|uniref:carboxymuconolactone decarboxylase family protein n=1 Tax=Flavobacterium sp. TaxID=239 RepID=UPI003D6BD472